MKKSRISWKKIAKNGGAYDTRKYRYIIDNNGDIKRTELINLDTTAMLRPDVWEYLITPEE